MATNFYLLHRIDLESAEFGSHLEPFLHEKTQHFMYELVSFAKSPYDMIAYDNKVKYDWPETHPQAQEQSSGGNGEEITDTSSQPGTHVHNIIVTQSEIARDRHVH